MKVWVKWVVSIVCRDADVDPLSIKGEHISARCWSEKHNGLTIKITQPEEIEVL
jgi:hypothetical protein